MPMNPRGVSGSGSHTVVEGGCGGGVGRGGGGGCCCFVAVVLCGITGGCAARVLGRAELLDEKVEEYTACGSH